MDHLKRDARLDQRLVVPERVVFHLLRGPGRRRNSARSAASTPWPRAPGAVRCEGSARCGSASRRYPRHGSQRRSCSVPENLVNQGRMSVGDSVERPQPDFRAALNRILPPVSLFHADAEDAADGLRAHGRAVLLGVLPISPWRHQAAARLAVGEEDGRQFADASSYRDRSGPLRRCWGCSARRD